MDSFQSAMKRSLIIGAAGFVGAYLIDCIAENQDMSIYATKLPNEKVNRDNVTVFDLDIMDKEAIVALLFEVRPDYIYHLAAQSSVGVAWKNPSLTIDVNIKGSINVMDAVRELYYKPKVLLIGSGEEYGYIKPEEIPINEENRVRPGNIYAATKACQNMIGHIYAKAYDMELYMVRAFNHIGPGQAPLFVVSDFCKQVAEIEKGLREPVIYVGNLDSRRDFTDVRDVVRAYTALIETGVSGETYNVGSGNALCIRDILQTIITMSEVKIDVQIDPNKLRPIDIMTIEADTHKIYELTGWKPMISISQTIEETLNFWRAQV